MLRMQFALTLSKMVGSPESGSPLAAAAIAAVSSDDIATVLVREAPANGQKANAQTLSESLGALRSFRASALSKLPLGAFAHITPTNILTHLISTD